jgi:hypothetical protein
VKLVRRSIALPVLTNWCFEYTTGSDTIERATESKNLTKLKVAAEDAREYECPRKIVRRLQRRSITT